MDEKTLTALQGSIAKWQGVLDGAIENGWRDCPLCALFYDDAGDGENACSGCPVSERTGFDTCTETPYDKWSNYQWDRRKETKDCRRVFDAESKRLAQSELDFLKSLLPAQFAASNASQERK